MVKLLEALARLASQVFGHFTSPQAQNKRKEDDLEDDVQEFREDLADGDRERLDAHLAADHDRVRQILRNHRRDEDGHDQQE